MHDPHAHVPDRDESTQRVTRRTFFSTTALTAGAAGLAVSLPLGVEAAEKPAALSGVSDSKRMAPVALQVSGTMPVTLQINGTSHQLQIDPRATLLDTLRETVDLNGTKKGCDQGQCGACTVHVNGARVLSCLTLTAQVEGRRVTTIEGLRGADGVMHAVQAAFMERDAFQCGYCTPGQIMSAVACIREGHTGSDDEIREYMSGNICRCGAYPQIVAAVRDAASRVQSGRAVPPAGTQQAVTQAQVPL